MSLNSYSLLFVFLPLAWLGYVVAGRLGARAGGLGWLTLCAVGVYGYWSPLNLLLIGASIAGTYGVAVGIRRARADEEGGKRHATWLLMLGVAGNLLYLASLKFWGSLLPVPDPLPGATAPALGMVLPLGISFITFRAITFLMDARSGKVQFDLAGYLAFVFFFPDLSAGPIVHYREVMPQFEKKQWRVDRTDVLVGLCLVAIGLFKKTVLADGIAGVVAPVYAAAAAGHPVGAVPAWIAALGYSLQIYFDFSGYSDIAIGLARLFGIRLPVNFNSPFKSSNIVDFWGRWHMSLSRFLNTYVYMPVMLRVTSSRTRRGKPMMANKRLRLDAFASVVMAPTLLTMFLSGLWHGTNATFLLWGVLHGAYLGVNQAWRAWRPKWNLARYDRVMVPLGFVLTFLAVAVAIVIFRAASIPAALGLLRAMLGLDGEGASAIGSFGGLLGWLDVTQGMTPSAILLLAWLFVATLLLIATLTPNSQELLRDFEPALDFPPKKSAPAAAAGQDGSTSLLMKMQSLRVRANAPWAVWFCALLVLGSLGLRGASAFIYWGF